MSSIRIDNTCLGSQCNSCVGTCPWGAITADPVTGSATVDSTKCIGAEQCQKLNGGYATMCQDYCPLYPTSLTYP